MLKNDLGKNFWDAFEIFDYFLKIARTILFMLAILFANDNKNPPNSDDIFHYNGLFFFQACFCYLSIFHCVLC